MSNETAALNYHGQTYSLPVHIGTEDEHAIDISKLRDESGLITMDEGYGNTGSCKSAITYIDGEKGILRYRGYAIEELVERSTFVETSYLIIFGELPTRKQLQEFSNLLTENQFIHEDLRHHFEGFPRGAPPMAILSAVINAAGCFQPELREPEKDEKFVESAARVMSKVRTIASASYKKSIGHPLIYPRFDLPYTANFLYMMFCLPNMTCEPHPDIVRALDQIFLLHADHEQNCSTSTVRMVASAQASLYASIAAGICALWGPLHGGANTAVIEMLTHIHESGESLETYLEKVKTKKAGARLMGFGHRVYKNFDPRARFIKKSCDTVLERLGIHDPLLDLAKRLEEIALKDEYFVERKLYPNVDFYSGIILRAVGIPVNMFTVIFAIGRMPGWIANWREVHMQSNGRIYRPRQIYTGPKLRSYAPIELRT